MSKEASELPAVNRYLPLDFDLPRTRVARNALMGGTYTEVALVSVSRSGESAH